MVHWCNCSVDGVIGGLQQVSILKMLHCNLMRLSNERCKDKVLPLVKPFAILSTRHLSVISMAARDDDFRRLTLAQCQALRTLYLEASSNEIQKPNVL